MSNSRYGSLSPRAIHRALFLQPSSLVAPQRLLSPSTIKEICNGAQKLELGGASSVWCWLFLYTQESGKRLIGHWNDGIMIIPRASIIQPPQWCVCRSVNEVCFWFTFLPFCSFAPLFLCSSAPLFSCCGVEQSTWSVPSLGCSVSPQDWMFPIWHSNQPTNQGTNTINTTPTPTKHNTKTTQAQQPTNRPANQQPTNQQRQAQL